MLISSLLKKLNRRTKAVLLFALLAGLTALAAVYLPRIIPRLTVQDHADLPVNTAGYEIQPLPRPFSAVSLHESRVYFGDTNGLLFVAQEETITRSAEPVPSPISGPPRLLFVSQSGNIYVGGAKPPVYRSTNSGRSWQPVLDISCWRMTELEPGILAMGNYPGRPANSHEGLGATVYLSKDDGVTWKPIELSQNCFHVHTVRWDGSLKRLYVAYGDASDRGEGYLSWPDLKLTVTGSGRGHGHTDIAITRDHILWGSDDQTGRILRDNHTGTRLETLLGWSQYIWWINGQDEQVYLGTMPGKKTGGEKPVILASSDQGKTWQKLLEGSVSRKDYDHGWGADSRQLSPQGWIYFSNDETAYRIRKK